MNKKLMQKRQKSKHDSNGKSITNESLFTIKIYTLIDTKRKYMSNINSQKSIVKVELKRTKKLSYKNT